MRLIMLGTGMAMVTKCYNTCFVLADHTGSFMVDGGGGNGIFRQAEAAGVKIAEIRDFFITHKHTDHILGMIWVLRMVTERLHAGWVTGEYRFYGHEEVIRLLKSFAEGLFKPALLKQMEENVRFITVEDGDTCRIMGRNVTFFDIGSAKAKQFGFTMELEAGGTERLTCCGDEPLKECGRRYAEGVRWLLHEAFCEDAQEAFFHAHEYFHSTVKEACETAERLGVKNLVLYHSEDVFLEERKRRYLAEGRQYFSGGLYVPDDLEVIELN